MRITPRITTRITMGITASHVVAGVLLAAGLLAAPHVVAAQTGTTTDRGAAALGSVLESLGTTGRVLTVAAHPDDEDTPLIAWLTRGRHVETAYLSLTRGDGGQNLIGNELGEALGAIRTQELLSARRIDGGHQFFTRAYDFGFSKNAEETFAHWPKDSILGDVIRVVRSFRPHVMVGFFSGTPRDGHGHHQVSGILAREAYELAGDTVRFPVAQYGLPWTPLKFYRSARQNPDGATLRVNVGEYNPLLGRSYYEIAAESRSQHKSQGFGVLQRKGAIMAYVEREATRRGPAVATEETGLFDGVDTTWARLRADVSPRIKAALDSATQYMATAKALYRASEPSFVVSPLASALPLLRRAQSEMGGPPSRLIATRAGATPRLVPARTAPQVVNLDAWDALSTTITRVENALVLAAGVAVEATAPKATFPVRLPTKPGMNDSLPVTVTVYNRGRQPVQLVSARAYAGETPTSNAATTIAADSAFAVTRFAVATAPTSPWWRESGRRGGDWFQTPIDGRDEVTLEERTETIARTTVQIAGVPVTIATPIVNRFADPIKGDQQVRVVAVPGITVGLNNVVEYIRAGVPVARDLVVRLQSAYPTDANVTVSLTLPPGLKADSAERTRVLAPERGASVVFHLTGTVPAGRHQLGAVAIHEATSSTSGYYTVDYDHITPQRVYSPSGMFLSSVNVKIPARAHVGYIVGSGDLGMDALEQLDVAVEKLDPAALATTDLTKFTAIVVGPRAYESSAELVRQNPRLLDYASRGGTLVVQYGAQNMNQYPVTPYPLQWANRAARVTQEDAEVRVLQPTSPLLNQPNKIGADDWFGWVQERATYMPSTIDSRYTPLLGMNDPDEPENQGGLLVAPVGKGKYVYVTLALFRQLPSGVPGAARLLLNLINAEPLPAKPKM
jgi:LmbE family N-acetylglucosaminyl deacetylase